MTDPDLLLPQVLHHSQGGALHLQHPHNTIFWNNRILSFFDEWLARGEEMEAGSELQCLSAIFGLFQLKSTHFNSHLTRTVDRLSLPGRAYTCTSLIQSSCHSQGRSGFFCPWKLSSWLITRTVIFIYYVWNKDSNIQKFLYTWSLWLLLSMTLSLQL